MKVLSILTDIE